MKITHINPDSMLKNPAFSQAVMVEDAKKIVYIGEQNGVDASGVVVGDDLESQTEQAYRNVLEVLRSVGATQENVVKQTILVAKGQDIQAGYAAAQRVWGAHPIALTAHIVEGFGVPGALVGIEAVCALGE
jgi:enamine deaminase RidA (YjgF/YER057c/UK114 family)